MTDADTTGGVAPQGEGARPQALARGAGWYADPYGSATEQRWYDGRKWTGLLRPTDAEDTGPSPRLRARPAHRAPSADPVPESSRRPSGLPGFPVSLSDTAGQRLWLVDSGSRRRFGYHLLSDSGRAASLRLFDRSRVATLASADGSWSLTKGRQAGWELLVRGADGTQIGSYSPRRWRAGGTILLASGNQADLLRTVTGAWKVRQAGGGEPLAAIRPGGRPGETRTAVSVHSLADYGPEAGLMILVACAVVTLERSTHGAPTVLAPSPPGRALAGRGGADRRSG